jgi:glycosyltransferase involved in cell wall biosynthesis
MRILHLIDSFPAAALYQEGHLALEQARAGHSVVLATMRVVGSPQPDLPFRVVVLPSLPTPRHQRIPTGLGGLLRSFAPDAVHAHGLNSFLTMQACWYRGKGGYTLLVDNHNSELNTRTGGLIRRLGARAFRSTAARLVRSRADHVVAIAEPERRFAAMALALPEASVDLIPLGVDTEVFRPSAKSRAKLRAELGLTEHDLVLVHAGRLTRAKGVVDMIDAASLVYPKPVVLLIGPMSEDLRHAVADRSQGIRVEIQPFSPKPRLAALLNAADIGIWCGLPSLTLLEALSVGLPVVAGPGPHYPPLLGIDGLYASSVEDLAAQIGRLASNPEQRRAIGNRHRRRMRSSRSWADLAAQFVTLYEDRERPGRNAGPRVAAGDRTADG